jgi:hypothetical protein
MKIVNKLDRFVRRIGILIASGSLAAAKTKLRELAHTSEVRHAALSFPVAESSGLGAFGAAALTCEGRHAADGRPRAPPEVSPVAELTKPSSASSSSSRFNSCSK